jgi:hypothetical protein
MSDERIPLRLTLLPATLKAEGYTPIDYRLIREAAINGVFPAHQKSGNWQFFQDDVVGIATALRLMKRQTAAA